MEKKEIASATVTVVQFDDGSIKSFMKFSPDFSVDYKSHRQIVNAGNKIHKLNNPTTEVSGELH